MSLIPRASFFDTDRFFGDFWSPFSREAEPAGSFFAPRVDITDKEDHYEITAELPGVDKDDIHVRLENGVLSLEAETSSEDEEQKDGKVIRRERRYGKFSRSFNLGGGVQEDDIDASFKDGILTLRAPKLDDPAPASRRISIS